MQNKNLPQITTFDKLLQLNKIESHNLQALSPKKQIEFRKLLADKLAAATGEERDAFLEKIESIIDPENVWEYNHARIVDAISQYVTQFSALPTKVALAEATGLSRKTIHKHLKSVSAGNAGITQTDMQPVLLQQVLNKVLQTALKGDVAAAKLYLQTTTKQQGSPDITINNQNNYIQINGTVFTQQLLQNLKPEALQQIEAIIKTSLPQ